MNSLHAPLMGENTNSFIWNQHYSYLECIKKNNDNISPQNMSQAQEGSDFVALYIWLPENWTEI